MEQSEIIPAVWCLITLKCGLVLLYYAKHYQVNDTENAGLVVTEENVEEDA